MRNYTDRQIEILTASQALIAEVGLSGLTLRNIAARVGMSEPGVYRHFANKLEICQALLDRVEESLVPLFAELRGETDSLEEDLGALFSGIYTRISEEGAPLALLFSEELFHSLPEIRPRVLELMERQQARIAAFIEAAQARGHCRRDLSSEDLTIPLLGTIRLMVSRQLLEGKGETEAGSPGGAIRALATMMKVPPGAT